MKSKILSCLVLLLVLSFNFAAAKSNQFSSQKFSLNFANTVNTGCKIDLNSTIPSLIMKGSFDSIGIYKPFSKSNRRILLKNLVLELSQETSKFIKMDTKLNSSGGLACQLLEQTALRNFIGKSFSTNLRPIKFRSQKLLIPLAQTRSLLNLLIARKSFKKELIQGIKAAIFSNENSTQFDGSISSLADQQGQISLSGNIEKGKLNLTLKDQESGSNQTILNIMNPVINSVISDSLKQIDF